MHNLVKLSVAASVAITVAACGSSSSGGSSGSSAGAIPSGPIKVGALFTLSGPSAAFGANEKQIEQIAVQRLNAAGGIAGHQVKLVALNDQGDVSKAVSAASELVQDKVAAVMYPGTTATNLQTSPVFMKAKVPVITYDPADEYASGTKWPYFFDTYPLNKPSMVAEANFIKSSGVTKVALLHDDTPFADELAPDFVNAAKAAGIQIAATATYPATATNVTTEVSRLKASGANTLVLIAQVGIGTVYQGLNSINWSPTIVGTAVDYFVGYDTLGGFAHKSYANCGVSVQKGQKLDPKTASLVDAVVTKTGPQPDYASTILNVNDDLQILKYAIEKANSLDGTAIANAIESIHDQSFTSPTYSYTFTKTDHSGYPDEDAHVCLLSPLGQDGTPIIAPQG